MNEKHAVDEMENSKAHIVIIVFSVSVALFVPLLIATAGRIVGNQVSIPGKDISAMIQTGETRDLQFGGYKWRVIGRLEDRALVVTEDIIEKRDYHSTETDVTWDTRSPGLALAVDTGVQILYSPLAPNRPIFHPLLLSTQET